MCVIVSFSKLELDVCFNLLTILRGRNGQLHIANGKAEAQRRHRSGARSQVCATRLHSHSLGSCVGRGSRLVPAQPLAICGTLPAPKPVLGGPWCCL